MQTQGQEMGIHSIGEHPLSGGRLPEVWQALKQYKDPANIAADALTGYLSRGMGEHIEPPSAMGSRTPQAIGPAESWGKGTSGTPIDVWGKRVPERAPVPRPAPAWMTQPTEGTPVPSILDREPKFTSVGERPRFNPRGVGTTASRIPSDTADAQPVRIASPNLQAPVTENPVVGSLVRAMQKSGVPIAERPNLLLKGSGRVNRILGPEEDLTDSLTKSLRQAKRLREQ
jgi:hypothetical protein